MVLQNVDQIQSQCEFNQFLLNFELYLNFNVFFAKKILRKINMVVFFHLNTRAKFTMNVRREKSHFLGVVMKKIFKESGNIAMV